MRQEWHSFAFNALNFLICEIYFSKKKKKNKIKSKEAKGN